MFARHKQYGKPWTKFYCRKYFTTVFIGMISEIVNDSDSYGSIFNEIYDGDICRVEYILITRNKKIIFDNHTHQRVTQVISERSLEFASGYSTPYVVSVRMFWDRFLALLMIF